jgi:hypothetical protein
MDNAGSEDGYEELEDDFLLQANDGQVALQEADSEDEEEKKFGNIKGVER